MSAIKKPRKKAIPKKVKTEVWIAHNGDRITGKCYACGGRIRIDDFQAGHVIPECQGGQVTVSNLRPVCKPCNTSSATMNLEEFKKMVISEQKEPPKGQVPQIVQGIPNASAGRTVIIPGRPGFAAVGMKF